MRCAGKNVSCVFATSAAQQRMCELHFTAASSTPAVSATAGSGRRWLARYSCAAPRKSYDGYAAHYSRGVREVAA